MVSKIESLDLGKQAYEQLKQMILQNQLKPGEKIVQEKLALDLGISRTPLRDALQMLEAEYLVQSIPRRGVIVRSISLQEMLDIYDCRMALECKSVELFTQRCTPVDITNLESYFKPFTRVKSINTHAYQKADSDFHEAILQGSRNAFLEHMFKQGHLLAYINRIGLVRPPQETLSEHRRIVDAIRKRDSNRAAQMMYDHLAKSKMLIQKKVEEGHG